MIDPGPRLRWFTAVWNRFWFAPVAADNLGLCRLLFYALFFRIYGPRDYTLWADVDHVFWMPSHLFEILRLQPLGHEALLVLSMLWKVAMVTSAIGLFTRLSTATACILAIVFLGMPHSFGKMHHSDALGMLIFVALALAPSGAAWSVDAWWRRRRGRVAPTASGAFHWPVRFVQVMMVTVFFAAGVAKLRVSGLEWIFSDNIRNTIIWHYYNFEPPFALGLWLAQFDVVARGLALASVALEVAAPLALIGTRARLLLVPSLYLMQLGFWALMGIAFPPYLFCYYLFWVPWDRLVARMRRRVRTEDHEFTLRAARTGG